MSDRTGQVWKLGEKMVYLVLEPPRVAKYDPNNDFCLPGSLEHRTLELEDGYCITLVELSEGDWEKDGYRRRLL